MLMIIYRGMFPYDEEVNNDWISMTCRSPKKNTISIVSKKKIKNNISDLFFGVLFALVVALFSTATPSLIYFFRLNLL